MNLAHQYAQIVTDVDVKKLFSYMKKRGHLSLLPRIVRILERQRVTVDTLTVAHERDAKAVQKKHPTSATIVDPRIVGGYAVRRGTKLVDATYRTALVSLYQRITQTHE